MITLKLKAKTLLLVFMIAANGFAQGVIDVHSHIITHEFVSALKSEGRLMDEGFPLPKYDVENHLKWMDEAGVETSVLTLAAPQPSSAEGSISTALEDCSFSEIQAGHAPHGERPEAAHHETPRPKDHATDI